MSLSDFCYTGTVLKQLPRMFLGFSRLLVTTWSHEPTVLNISNVLHINSALQYSSVLVQAYGVMQSAETVIVPFPLGMPNKLQGIVENQQSSSIIYYI